MTTKRTADDVIARTKQLVAEGKPVGEALRDAAGVVVLDIFGNPDVPVGTFRGMAGVGDGVVAPGQFRDHQGERLVHVLRPTPEQAEEIRKAAACQSADPAWVMIPKSVCTTAVPFDRASAEACLAQARRLVADLERLLGHEVRDPVPDAGRSDALTADRSDPYLYRDGK